MPLWERYYRVTSKGLGPVWGTASLWGRHGLVLAVGYIRPLRLPVFFVGSASVPLPENPTSKATDKPAWACQRECPYHVPHEPGVEIPCEAGGTSGGYRVPFGFAQGRLSTAHDVHF